MIEDTSTAPYILDDGGALDYDRCPDCWEKRAHLERYQFAALVAGPERKILDFGCGVGYGTALLRSCGHSVLGVDTSEQAMRLAEERYGMVGFQRLQIRPTETALRALARTAHFDICCALEVLEHLERPELFLQVAARTIPELVVSVPVIPTVGVNPHHRHDFTIDSFRDLVGRFYREAWWWIQVRPFHHAPSICIIHGVRR